jgi:zinc transport system substrate-binding protein
MNRLRLGKSFVYAMSIFIMSVSVFIIGCARDGGNDGDTRRDSDKKIKIVATLFPQYDFARQIAGDYADVTLLLPPGMESHSYDLRPSDMIEIRESDMFIYTGKYMETWAQTIIDSLDDSVMVVDVSDGITLEREEDYFVDELEEHGEDGHDEDAHEHNEDEHEEEAAHEHDEDEHEEAAHGHEDEHDEEAAHEHEDEEQHTSHSHAGHTHEYDPHIWTSPVYAMQMVENIVDALVSEDPQHESEYRQRADEYIAKLKEVDSAFRQVSETAQHRTIFFGGRFAMTYFVREYGFACVSAYHDCSAESEPSISSVMKMIDEIKASGAKAVFYEELVDPKVARTIAEETQVKLLLLHSAHNVSREEYENGVTYLDIMWQNVKNLEEGLN